MLFFNWRYARKHHLTDEPTEQKNEIGKALKRRGITAQICYAAGALLCLINNYLPLAILIAVQVGFALGLFSRRMKSNKR